MTEKKGLFWAEHLFFGEREGFLSCRLPLLSLGDGEGPCDGLLVVDQKVPYWLIKINQLKCYPHMCCLIKASF